MDTPAARPLSPSAIAFCRSLSRASCWLSGLAGIAALVGWMTDTPLLTSFASGWASMKPSSAVALLLASGALWLLTTEERADGSRHRLFAQVAAGGVALIGLLALAEHRLGPNLHIGDWLVRATSGAIELWQGRMSALAATDFLLLGVALLLIAGKPRNVTVWIANLFLLGAAFGAFIALTGYLYGREALGRHAVFAGTALPTALALLALCVGVATARPRDGVMALFTAATAGGSILRRLILPVTLLPVAINWLELEGERRGVFPEGFGWMLDSAVTVVLGGLVVWIVSHLVHEKDLARLAAQDALGRSEERYRQLTEMSPLAIIVKDARRIEFANPAARELVGATNADDMVGKSPFAFVHPDSRANFERQLCEVITEGTSLPRSEQKIVRLDGREVDVVLSVTPVTFHGQRFAQVVAQDVTAARRVAQLLRESEERFHLIAETISEAFWMAEVDPARTIYVSPAYEKLWGRPCESLYRHPRSFLDAVHPDDRDRVILGLEVEKQGLPFALEYRLVQPDGTIRWVSDRGYPVPDTEKAAKRYVGVTQDITERKQAEAALGASVERLQMLAGVTGDAIWDWDVRSDTTWWSATFFAQFGYPNGSIPTFDAWIEHVHPEDRERAMAEFDDAIARKAVAWSSEYRFRLADGSYGVILDRVYGILDAAGELVRMLGSMVDISHLRRIEEQTRLLAHAVESTNELISITSQENKFLFANRAFLNAYGYRLAEILGRTPDLLLSPTHVRATLTEAIRDGAMTSNWNGELVNRRKDGTEFTIQLSASPVHDGQGRVIALMGVAQDITERKRTEAQLQANEERFRATFEQAAMGMVIASLDGRFLRVNGKFCAITGYSSDDLLARTFRDITDPDDLDGDLEGIDRVRTGEVQTHAREIRYRRKDGTPVWVARTLSLVRGPGGEPDYVLGIVQDITTQRTLEAQLSQSQKMDSIGRLAGGVAHDFNNMLAVILGHTELALLTVDPSEPLHADLKEVYRAGERSAALTRQLLAFARKQRVEPTVLDLNDAVGEMLNMLRRLVGENIDLSWRPGAGLWPVMVDRGQVDQILVNLCVNARDAIAAKGGHGGDDLTVETRNASLDEEYCAWHAGCVPGDFVAIIVTDSGCGMNQKTQAKIFEPFFTTKGVGAGTGLGLSTVYGIVKQNEGFVEVRSEPGRGATFTVYLPRHVGEAAPIMATAGVAISRGGETVLIVDDEPTLLAISGAILKGLGYRVLGASSADEALRLAGEHKGEIQLLLTDVIMPEMSGSELARRLSAQGPSLKCMFMSGYTADIMTHDGMPGDNVAFVEKPFTRAQLANKVREVLDRP